MKMKTGFSKKLRYGGVTAALTAAIIAIVVIVNVIFSALAQKHLWYTDLTPELFFTLSENAITLMKEGDTSFEKSTSPIKKIDEFRAAAKAKNPALTDKELKVRIDKSPVIEYMATLNQKPSEYYIEQTRTLYDAMANEAGFGFSLDKYDEETGEAEYRFFKI